MDLAEQAAKDRAEDEAESEGGAEDAEGAAAVFRGGDVGNIGIGNRDSAREDARKGPAEEQDAECRGEAEDDHVDAQHGDRD